MVASLFLLRHGKTAFSGRLVGSTDVGLTSTGGDQIRAIRPALRREKIDRIFCSPMRRCRETARILELDGEIFFVDDLKEIDFGRWEGLEFSEIEKRDPEYVRNWVEDPKGFCFPGGECCADFIARLEAFKERVQCLADEKVLIITHGGVIRHLICLFLGVSVKDYLLYQVREGLLATLDCFGKRGVLTGLNRNGVR